MDTCFFIAMNIVKHTYSTLKALKAGRALNRWIKICSHCRLCSRCKPARSPARRVLRAQLDPAIPDAPLQTLRLAFGGSYYGLR